MSIYQISGLPGSGKTSIQNELTKLGFDTINTDEEWGYYGNLETEEPVEYPTEPTREWFIRNGYIWDSKKVRALLTTPREKSLFICGGSRNEAKFYDLFTKIFVLYISDELRRERMGARGEPKHNNELFF